MISMDNLLNIVATEAHDGPDEGCQDYGHEPSPRQRDPMDDPGYQRFLAETAKRCLSRYAPCAGCCAGGMCDNFDGIEDREDDEPGEPMDEEHEDDLP